MSDSKILVDMVSNKCKINGNIPSLFQHNENFLYRDCHLEVIRTLREDNKSGDHIGRTLIYHRFFF